MASQRLAANIVALIAVLSLALTAAPLVKLVSGSVIGAIVATGSMEPSIPRYSIVFAKREPPGWIPVGSVVLYTGPGSDVLFIHRIIGSPGGGRYLIRGDNVMYTEEVEYSRIRGVYILGFSIGLGKLVEVARDPYGALVIALTIVSVIILAIGSALERAMNRGGRGG